MLYVLDIIQESTQNLIWYFSMRVSNNSAYLCAFIFIRPAEWECYDKIWRTYADSVICCTRQDMSLSLWIVPATCHVPIFPAEFLWYSVEILTLHQTHIQCFSMITFLQITFTYLDICLRCILKNILIIFGLKWKCIYN